MRKGHRRTHSDMVLLSNHEDSSSHIGSTGPLTNHEIAQLLTISNQKIKEKISNIDTLNVQLPQTQHFFLFGKTISKDNILPPIKYTNLNSLISIPEKKEANTNLRFYECPIVSSIQGKQHLRIFERSPFSETINYSSNSQKSLKHIDALKSKNLNKNRQDIRLSRRNIFQKKF